MQKHEQKEPSIIVNAHTLVQPVAMVVEFFYAVIADGTMLGPRWLHKFACFAISVFLV